MDKEQKNIYDQIYKYEADYFINNNLKNLILIKRVILGIFIVAILSIFINFVTWAFKINFVLGIISILLSIFIIVYFFIVPYKKLFSLKSFSLDTKDVKHSIIYNIKVRNDMANHIIDFHDKAKDVKWYDDASIDKLKNALCLSENDDVRIILSDLVNNSIRKNSQSIIVNYAVKAGVASAISQSEKIDAILILINNVLMIKDLVFLYGFRPGTFKMIKIYSSILVAVATAYGMQQVHIGSNVFPYFLKFLKPLFKGVGSAGVVASALTGAGAATTGVALTINTLINILSDSTVQGLANGGITACIGYQTIDYLRKEYRLQDLLQDIDLLDDENEFRDTCKQIESKLKKEERMV